MFHLQSSETLKHLSDELMAEITELSRKALAVIRSIFEDGIQKGVFLAQNPVVLADIFWSLFSGVVLWEESKRIVNKDKDFLKPTLEIAFDIFNRGLRQG